jgi:23S rRNA (guanosine2251-2'-O)-methyltransferase
VVARIEMKDLAQDLDELLEQVEKPLLLVLDGVTDPHNLGACLRVANAAGAHAVIAPRDRAAGITPAVSKVASGAAEATPYLMVTNLARTLAELKERDIWILGADEHAEKTLYEADLPESIAWVLGAEGEGMRRLTREGCDFLVKIPMRGAVDSLNVSVSAGICLFESVRRRVKAVSRDPGR